MDDTCSFTAHNIRLGDGTETFPSLGVTMDQHPITLSAVGLFRTVFPGGLEGRSVVDVGCLEGGYATEFARVGMDSTGLEVRDSNFAACLYVKGRTNFPNLHFIQGNANDIAGYGEFDAFFVNGLLYHLDRPRAFLEAVARNCRKVMIVNTHVSYIHRTEGANIHSLSEICENEGLKGRWFSEHGDISQDELNRLKWASWQTRNLFGCRKSIL